MMEFYSETNPKARKPHQCDCCGGVIEAGSGYVRQTGKWDGDFFCRDWHEDCNEVMQYFFDFLTVDDEFDYDEVFYAVQDDICKRCQHWEADDCEADLWHCPEVHRIIAEKYDEIRKKREEKKNG